MKGLVSAKDILRSPVFSSVREIRHTSVCRRFGVRRSRCLRAVVAGDHASGYEVELGHPLAGASPDGMFEDPGSEFTFVGGIPMMDEPVPYFVAHGSDHEAFDDLLDDHASIERFEPIPDGPEGRHHRCEWATRDGDILSAIREYDGIASRLGITEQALSQRLRRALRNLVGSTIDDPDRGSRSE